MPKIIRILRSCSMKIFSKFPTVNISKLNFWLVICIAKNFIWTTLKMIFSIFRFFCTLRFQIYKYCPIITNHTSMERLFIQLSDDQLKKVPLWLVLCTRVTYSNYIKKRIGGKYAALLGDFSLESSENLYNYIYILYYYIITWFFSKSTLLTLSPSNGRCLIPTSHTSLWRYCSFCQHGSHLWIDLIAFT